MSGGGWLSRAAEQVATFQPPDGYRVCGYGWRAKDGEEQYLGCKRLQRYCGSPPMARDREAGARAWTRLFSSEFNEDFLLQLCMCCGTCFADFKSAMAGLMIAAAGEDAVAAALAHDWRLVSRAVGLRRPEWDAYAERVSDWLWLRREERGPGDGLADLTCNPLPDERFDRAVWMFAAYGRVQKRRPPLPAISGPPARLPCSTEARLHGTPEFALEALCELRGVPVPEPPLEPDEILPAERAGPVSLPAPTLPPAVALPPSPPRRELPAAPDPSRPEASPAIVPAHPEVERLRRRFWL